MNEVLLSAYGFGGKSVAPSAAFEDTGNDPSTMQSGGRDERAEFADPSGYHDGRAAEAGQERRKKGHHPWQLPTS